jgi:hypothetical protein
MTCVRRILVFDDRCGFNVQLQGLKKWIDYLFLISAQRDHSHIFSNQSVKLFSTEAVSTLYDENIPEGMETPVGTLSLKTAGDWA